MEKFSGIPYPIAKHSLGFLHAQGGIDQIKSDVLVLLQSNFGERVMLLDYGADLRQFLFEPNDIILAEQVRQAIINAINKWEPRVVVSNIDVSIPTANDPGINQEETQLEHILRITIDMIDPEAIQEVEQLVLEIPLS